MSGDVADISLHFKRRLIWPGVLLTLAEVIGVVLPLWNIFDLREVETGTLLRTVLPVTIGAIIVWTVSMLAWFAPIRASIALRKRGAKVPKDLAARAYRATLRIPLRAVTLRTALWAVGGAIVAIFLWRYASWPRTRMAEVPAVAGLNSFLIASLRAAWLARILGELRLSVFTVSPPLRRFADAFFRDMVLVIVVVWSGITSAQAAFLFYFVPITHIQFLQVETFVPVAVMVGIFAWLWLTWRHTAPLREYLLLAQSGGGDAEAVPAIYRRTQALPYRLALYGAGIWACSCIMFVVVARARLGLGFDDIAIILTTVLVVAIAGAIYASLWHRETLRPILAHLTQRYRMPVRGIAPSLTLRTKLLLSFGGVVLLACGMALVWGFVQYKNQATTAIARQADIGLEWLRSEVQADSSSWTTPPDAPKVQATLRMISARAPEASVILYYVSPDNEAIASADGTHSPLFAVGGGPMGAPRLPWYLMQQVERRSSSLITSASAKLAGRAGALRVVWKGTKYDVGSVAVFYPNYRGRGESMERPLKELLLFFVILFSACAGIVAATVNQFVEPIQRLERRADGMARGELADPVASSGEGDEIGRLTYALEEMRRALRERLRSTEEVNLDLERAVQMRTTDLATKNRELALTLDKLTQTQAQLVRSEKLASIGQLVAGIAHEINNPVNAIVNTVGPLEDSISDIESDDAAKRHEVADDIRDMVRVVKRGAQRTKAIVQALHNYSRTDDEQVVDFDLDRSLDDSLELLRHLLRERVVVEKRYGDVGRMRGHAGQLGQVFMNLLTNAAQAVAGREDARIVIETETLAATSSTRGESISIRIRDNGPGIPTAVLPRIWDPFFTTKEVGEGTGLGLSIVHELVQRHYGTIEVNTELGRGTEFHIVIPRRPPAVPASPPADA